MTKNSVIALYFAILADFTGMVPALIKTYKFPHTEIYAFYLIDVFSALFSILAVQNWSITELSYPLYIFVINLLMVAIILTSRR